MHIKDLFFLSFFVPKLSRLQHISQYNNKHLFKITCNKNMDLSYIHQQLKNINLNIDTQTIDDVERFLINDIGFINEI